MKTHDVNKRFDRIEEELDNVLIEVREARQEIREMSGALATLRHDLANRRCTGGSPAPAHPLPPTSPSIPYTPNIHPWGPSPRITWYCNGAPVL